MEIDPEELLAMSNADIDDSLKDFFDDEVWTRMSESDKEKYRQETVSYILNQDRDKLPIPTFLQEYKKSKRYLSKKGEASVSSGGGNQEIHASIGSKQIDEIESNKKKINEISIPSNNNSTEVQSKYPPKKYSKRQTAASVDYFEEEEPSDDRYIFCDNCNEEVVDYCKKCGMLVCIKDVKVPLGTDDRAKKTVPNLFEIRPSPLHGLGAFAAKTVPKGLQLGPYEGRAVKKDNESSSGYSWKLKKGRLVDAADERYSNWMRYVNCARHASEQNVVAFQYKGELYYRTARAIEKGTELLVFYGNEYCGKLGIDFKKYFTENNKNKKEENERKPGYFDPNLEKPNQDYYLCKFCNIGLSTGEFRDVHEKRCKFGKIQVQVKETFACKYCTLLYVADKDRVNHEKFCKKNPSIRKKG